MAKSLDFPTDHENKMMPIICFEGASAVGKTTTADRFRTEYDAFVVPEVNLLFQRPRNEPAEWYFERQVERWAVALEKSKTHPLVILDGDPFQPLWYGWAYHYVGRQSLEFMERFYRSGIRNKTIGFPDLYFVFSTGEVELRKRKDRDATRQRRGFDTHLQMIEPQRRYFRAMQEFSRNRVFFREAGSIETSVEFVRQRVNAFPGNIPDESGVLFGRMIQWLRENKA